MNIRQAVVFAILMQGNGGIMTKHPSYIEEKLELCEMSSKPENLLDDNRIEIFNKYVEVSGLVLS